MGHRLYQRIDDGPLEPAEFRTRQEIDGTVRYVVCCPACGTVTQLDAAIHRVQSCGSVTPIWLCSSEACSYIEWIVLTEVVP